MHTTSSAISCRSGAAQPGTGATVVIRTVRAGAEMVGGTGRSIRLDSDAYLVVDGAAPIVSTREPRTEPIAIELALPEGLTDRSFLPALRAISGPVGARLAEISPARPGETHIVLCGAEAADWWSALDAEERALRARALRIRCVRPATRDALFRRLLAAADFIQSYYAQPLNVDLVAAVSNLSPFHYARLFALVMDETPHAFLVRKRLAVARRLLAAGLGCAEAADRAGFGCRSTLYRHLRGAASAPS